MSNIISNIVNKNDGTNVMLGFNFILRVEGAIDCPCRAVKGLRRKYEYESIQEGGLNDYVHLKRKPISNPFTFQVERYAGMDLLDPLALGTELTLPLLLAVFDRPTSSWANPRRLYVFTGCTVIEKEYGDFNAENSNLLVETVTIAYRQMACVDNLIDNFTGNGIFGDKKKFNASDYKKPTSEDEKYNAGKNPAKRKSSNDRSTLERNDVDTTKEPKNEKKGLTPTDLNPGKREATNDRNGLTPTDLNPGKREATNDRSKNKRNDVDETKEATNDRSKNKRNDVDETKEATNDRSKNKRNDVDESKKATNDRSGLDRNDVDKSKKAENDRSKNKRNDVDESQKASNDRSGLNRDDIDTSKKASNDRSGMGRNDVDRGKKASNSRNGQNRNNVDRSRKATNAKDKNKRNNVNTSRKAANTRASLNRNDADTSKKVSNTRSELARNDVTARDIMNSKDGLTRNDVDTSKKATYEKPKKSRTGVYRY